MGNRTLQDSIENREQLAGEIKNIIDEAAEAWGIRVESILLLDIILERELLNSMSSAATQKRVGEARVISAQAQVASAMVII
jgi:erythrocyte band 7 integral membrane protein